VTLNPSGLHEAAQPYASKIVVLAVSDLINETSEIPVLLTVSAPTHTSVWSHEPVEVIFAGASYQKNFSDMLSQQATATAGGTLRVKFSALDFERLPVMHSVPAPGDNRSFSASLTDPTGKVMMGNTARYLGDGSYLVDVNPTAIGVHRLQMLLGGVPSGSQFIFTAGCPDDSAPVPDGSACGCLPGLQFSYGAGKCEACDPGTFKAAIGNDQCQACPAGSVSQQNGAASCDNCAQGSTPAPDAKSCTVCESPTSASPGSISCSICATGFFLANTSSAASGGNCKECPLGANCAVGTSAETLVLRKCFWRHSSATAILRSCKQRGDWSPCRGGNVSGSDVSGDGYCESGYRGPMCQLCDTADKHSKYFDTLQAKCYDCGDVTGRSAGIFAALVCVFLVWYGINTCINRAANQNEKVVSTAQTARFIWGFVGMRFKIKLFVGFFQCLAAAPSVFNVTLLQVWRISQRGWISWSSQPT
jgi:hypothetical protein